MVKRESEEKMKCEWKAVSGIIKRGHRVASGIAEDSPYPRGTIEMQMPVFKSLGLDLNPFYKGTLNISISPQEFIVKNPEYTFKNVKWHPEYPAEDFSFSCCRAFHNSIRYDGLIYYPHPETKISHFHDFSTLEVIAPCIPEISYGNRVYLEINPMEILLTKM